MEQGEILLLIAGALVGLGFVYRSFVSETEYGSLTIKGDLTVKGPLRIGGTLTAKGPMDIRGPMRFAAPSGRLIRALLGPRYARARERFRLR